MKSVDHPFGVTPRDRTLPRLLARQATRWGDRPLFVAGGISWSYADCARVGATMAGRLRQAGIRAGDRVAILSGNRAEVMALFLGTGCLGAILVPINTASKGPQIHYILENSGARLLTVEADLASALDLADLGSLPVERVWAIGGGDIAGEVTVEAFPDTDDDPASPVTPADPSPGDTVAILYTSGTTGPSKGVCCPHAQLFWWGVHTARYLELVEGDVLCTTLPLFHTNALNTFFQALLIGGTQVVEPRFSASRFWSTMAERNATATYLLGAMVPILMASPPREAERAHRVRVALAPGVPAGQHEIFTERTGIRLVDGFGSTESNFVIGGPAAERRTGFMGRVTSGFEARVVDDDDGDLPAGEAGELLLRADEPFAFATGYWGMAEKTVEAWRNLWLHTGDRVVRDTDGWFRFVDRKKDSIRRRGENISSFEVEQVLAGHPDIADVAVYPVPSALGEDEVMAALVPRDGAAIDPTAIIAYCEPRLPRFAVPRYLRIKTDLPKTENGKVRKFVLREEGVTTDAWDREAPDEEKLAAEGKDP